jgi:hypothetical protein
MRLHWPGIVLATTLLTACSPQHGTADDLPTSSTVHAYRAQGAVVANVAGLDVKPGQSAAFDAWIVNDSDHPVRVVGAKATPVPGQRRPQLTHLALAQGRNVVGVQHWPPSNLRTTPLIGHTLPPGRSHLAVAIAGRQPGEYLTAGTTLTISERGKRAQATAWGGGVVCVVTDMGSKRQLNRCDRAYDKAQDTLFDYLQKQ